jgi:hypothetical protein
LVFQILTDIQERYQAMLDRLRRIAELNHHIRNALQVIAYHNVSGASERFNKSTLRLFVLSQYCAKFLPPLATMRISPRQLCLSSAASGSTVFAAEHQSQSSQ